MIPSVGAVARTLEDWFPLRLAEPWDNVGLLLGAAARPAARVMTCLTVTPETAAEAVRRQASLVVAHHPILFRGAQRLTDGDPVLALAAAGVAAHSPHTAHDSAAGGVNAQWAARLGLADVRPLRPAAPAALAKLVVYLPEGDLDAVRGAAFAAGAGGIGAYDECGFHAAGLGSFRGGPDTNPTVGRPGVRETAPELRWETILPMASAPAVVAAVRAAHSYEEPALDLVPLAPLAAATVGGGRCGTLPEALPAAALAARCQAACGAVATTFTGPPERPCRRVAIACGAGADFLADARAAGCEAFVTGEATFHQQLAAAAAGVAMVLVGHYASERFAMEALARRLAATFPAAEIWASEDERDPTTIVSP
jgi:dinuclear metal center YbgI/SA1388 family protein